MERYIFQVKDLRHFRPKSGTLGSVTNWSPEVAMSAKDRRIPVFLSLSKRSVSLLHQVMGSWAFYLSLLGFLIVVKRHHDHDNSYK